MVAILVLNEVIELAGSYSIATAILSDICTAESCLNSYHFVFVQLLNLAVTSSNPPENFYGVLS